MMQVGDTILYKRKRKIKEWEINKISPTGQYIAIENNSWNERWIPVTDILENMTRPPVAEKFEPPVKPEVTARLGTWAEKTSEV
jgi:hypothetical protein